MKLSKGWLATIIIVGILLLDQALKVWVKTHFYLGEEVWITSWFRLLFIENNGMAFGMEIGSKLLLTLFRIVLVTLLICYIYKIRRRSEARTGYIVCLALITAGAAGNIIDSTFYGLIFNNPAPPQIAEFVSDSAEGYAPLFHGRVVDMLYFPLFSFYWPEWIPIIGGDFFLFFQPIFNIADAAISVGIIALILFYSKSFVPLHPSVADTDDEVSSDTKAS